jgi:hypothetical protein
MSLYPANELRTYFIDTLEICRLPSDNPQPEGPNAVCYVEPIGGAPYGPDSPVDSAARAGTTISITEQGGLSSIAGTGKYMETAFFRVDIRSDNALAAADVCRAITNALEDQQHMQIGELTAEYSGIYSRAQSLPIDQETSAGHWKTLTLALVIHREQLT